MSADRLGAVQTITQHEANLMVEQKPSSDLWTLRPYFMLWP